MAMTVTGNKGAIAVNNAYLVAVSLAMSRYLRPVETQVPAPRDDDPNALATVITMTPASRYEACVHVYKDRAERIARFNATELVATVQFEHDHGQDPIAELYRHIKAHGIAGWDFSSIEDEL